MKIDASKLPPELFDHLAALLTQCDLDDDLQLIAPEIEKAGVASKPVVTAALKEEVKKTGRKPVGDRPMTNAEHQARYRTRKKETSCWKLKPRT